MAEKDKKRPLPNDFFSPTSKKQKTIKAASKASAVAVAVLEKPKNKRDDVLPDDEVPVVANNTISTADDMFLQTKNLESEKKWPRPRLPLGFNLYQQDLGILLSLINYLSILTSP